MNDHERFKFLHGPYAPPRCRIGGWLTCRLRGRVRVRYLSAGRVQWPMTRVGRNKAYILCGDLVRALQRESSQAIQYWWGVGWHTVWTWRKALGISQYNEGTLRLHRDWMPERVPPEVHARAVANASTPEANARKAASKLGHSVSPKVAAILARGRQKCLTPAARKKMSESHKRRGTMPPAAGKPWTAAEEALLGTMSDPEVARRTARTLFAVRCRRLKLGIAPVRAIR
jgi:hypothetical protein